jgi:hypothetical protein
VGGLAALEQLAGLGDDLLELPAALDGGGGEILDILGALDGLPERPWFPVVWCGGTRCETGWRVGSSVPQ